MDSPIVGTEETWSLIRSSQRTVSGTSTGYGFGLVVDRYRGIDTLHHAGNAFGGNAQMLKVPAANLDIIVMSNRQDVLSTVLVSRILDECLMGLDSSRPNAQRVAIPSGIFRSAETGQVVCLFEREGKPIVSLGGLEFVLEVDDQGTLWFTDRFRKQGITLFGDRKNPDRIRFSDFGNIDDLIRVPRSEALAPASICGRFRCSSAGIDATISVASDGAVEMRTKGRFGSVTYRLTNVAHRIWQSSPTASRVRFLGGIISFDDREESFTFSNWQTRQLPFGRVD